MKARWMVIVAVMVGMTVGRGALAHETAQETEPAVTVEAEAGPRNTVTLDPVPLALSGTLSMEYERAVTEAVSVFGGRAVGRFRGRSHGRDRRDGDSWVHRAAPGGPPGARGRLLGRPPEPPSSRLPLPGKRHRLPHNGHPHGSIMAVGRCERTRGRLAERRAVSASR